MRQNFQTKTAAIVAQCMICLHAETIGHKSSKQVTGSLLILLARTLVRYIHLCSPPQLWWSEGLLHMTALGKGF